MANYFHHSNYQSLSEALIGFSQMARDNGLNAGVQETLDAHHAVAAGIGKHKETLRYALKALYCCEMEECDLFDKIFEWFWGEQHHKVQGKTTLKNQSNLQKKTAGSLVMLGKGNQQEGPEEDSKNVSGANEQDRLRKTDFSKVAEMDSAMLEEMAMKLWQQMSLRLKRKMKASNRKGRLDIRKTIRANIPYGGDPIQLKMRRRKPQRKRLVVLLDVSGSMDKYSFFLLRFLVALRSHFERIEAFIFSTKLIRITDYLHAQDLEWTLQLLSLQADHWSSGTMIGQCLNTFNEEYAKQVLNGHSTTIILSDGLDTGSPEQLALEMERIKLRTRQLIWLNPLKGMKGYEPIQRGMEAALPSLDVFRSAHNLDSILELENFLWNV
ncbi:MAG: VWA domain-containing protein [Bacteroidota bacterium]